VCRASPVLFFNRARETHSQAAAAFRADWQLRIDAVTANRADRQSAAVALDARQRSARHGVRARSGRVRRSFPRAWNTGSGRAPGLSIPASATPGPSVLGLRPCDNPRPNPRRARLGLGGRVVAPIQSNTLSPNWPNQKRGNYRIAPGASVKVQLWDSNPINNHPICAQTIKDFHEHVSTERHLEVTCDSGAVVELQVEPAHGKIGLGLFYEIRTDRVFVTRVLVESPAGRSGVRRGEEIVKIMGEPARGMPEGRVRSLINSNGSTGLDLVLAGADKLERPVTLKDGPIYATLDEDVF
jgi:hypothetical protein